MIKVSVIMPVYNVEKYLEECLRSVLCQSLREIEIICVNDGSTDGSLEILQRFGVQDSRVKIISQRNRGYGSAVNVGIHNACGQYISIVETDDFIDGTMLEELYEKAVEYRLDVVKADHNIVVSGKEGYEYTYRDALPERQKNLYYKVTNYKKDIHVFQGYVYTWAGLYKREFLNENQIWHNETPGASYQDNGFWFQTTMYAKRMMFLNKAYYNLRRDNPNSSIYSRKKIFCICDEYDFIRDKVLSANLEQKTELLYQVFYYRFLNYLFNMQRISSEYLQIFYERMRKDFLTALQNGEINPLLFSRVYWNYIYETICNPRVSLIEYISLPYRVKTCLSKYNTIFIYGAGQLGNEIYQLLSRTGFSDNVKGFVVTDKHENPSAISNVRVYSIDEILYDEDTLIIVAVGNRYIDEVQKILIEKKYKNRLLKREFYG